MKGKLSLARESCDDVTLDRGGRGGEEGIRFKDTRNMQSSDWTTNRHVEDQREVKI